MKFRVERKKPGEFAVIAVDTGAEIASASDAVSTAGKMAKLYNLPADMGQETILLRIYYTKQFGGGITEYHALKTGNAFWLFHTERIGNILRRSQPYWFNDKSQAFTAEALSDRIASFIESYPSCIMGCIVEMPSAGAFSVPLGEVEVG